MSVNDIGGCIENTMSMSSELNNIIGDVYNKMTEINNISQKINQNISNTTINNFNIDLQNVYSVYEEINQQQVILNNNIKDGEKKTEGFLSKIKKAVSTFVDIPDTSDMVSKAFSYSDNLSGMQNSISAMNDGGQSDTELRDKIYGASMRSRTDIGSVTETAGDLSSIGFSNDEAIQFTENLNKLFAIAGTGQEAQTSVTNEMVSALENGVVSSEELSSILSTAPEIVNAMAENMNMPVEAMMTLAEQGQLTGDILKNSMLGATDSINAQFGNVRASWSDTMTNVGNMAMVAFEPVGRQISDIINSQSFATVIGGIGQGMATIAPILAFILEGIANIGSFVVDNFGIIAPIIMFIVGLCLLWSITLGKVSLATAITAKVTKVFATISNSLKAIWETNPIVIVIMAIIAALYLVVAIINKVCGTSYSATGIIAGVIMTAIAVIWNAFLALADIILGIIGALINPFISIANFIGNVFTNPISSIIYLFRDMAVNVLSVIKTIASAIDKVFGTDMAGTVDGWIDGVNTLADKAVEKFAPDENYEVKYEKFDLSTESLGLKRMDYGDSFDSGYEFGEGLTDFSMPDIGSGLGDFGMSTGDVDYSNMFEGTGLTENTVNGINRSAEETGTNTYDISNYTMETGVNTENVAANTQNLGTNTENISGYTMSLESSNNELVNIGRSILGIMQENMKKEKSNNNSSVVIDMRYMSNNVKSQADADNLIERLKSEISAGLNGKTEGTGGSVFAMSIP